MMEVPTMPTIPTQATTYHDLWYVVGMVPMVGMVATSVESRLDSGPLL
jgi:hypothetical protein